MQSPHADSKKQRREEKIATRKAKLDKKEELKKKKRELKAKMSNLDAGTSKAVSTAKTDHPADNSHPEVGKLAPALNTGPFTFADRGNAPQERRQKDSAPDPRLEEGHRRGDDSSSSAAESGTGPDSGSNVEDIHTVADTLPRRNLSSYQIFIPGQGLTNAPASPEASSCREVQWQQGQQQGQQIHFSTGSGGHASKHGDHAGRNQQYDSSRNGPFSSGGNQPPMGPPLASNHWGAELDQFSGFSGDGSQDWEQVPFIEGVSPDPLPARNGRNQPSSSRLQVVVFLPSSFLLLTSCASDFSPGQPMRRSHPPMAEQGSDSSLKTRRNNYQDPKVAYFTSRTATCSNHPPKVCPEITLTMSLKRTNINSPRPRTRSPRSTTTSS